MAKMIHVEHHRADGTMTEHDMRKRDWKRWAEALPAFEPGEFCLVFGDLKKRWDGCRLMTYQGFLCCVGFRVELEDRNGQPVPVVHPCDD